MKKLALILISLAVLTSCSNDDDTTPEAIPVTVTLKAVVSGALNNSPVIQYRDASGDLKSETLTVGTWEKSLNVTSGYNLFLKTTGTINGSVEITASAEGEGISFDDSKSSTANVDVDFELEISKTL
ncbi:hypothetical protein [Aquimarina sp. 433]